MEVDGSPRNGSPRTCEAIVKATIVMEIEGEDRLDTWIGEGGGEAYGGHCPSDIGVCLEGVP